MKRREREIAPGIFVDPMICSGKPCVGRTRIIAQVVYGRFLTGENINEIADDYGISPRSICEAIRYCINEYGNRAKKAKGASA